MSAREPITSEEAGTLLLPVRQAAGQGAIAIAVSGGADSMALLWMCAEHFPAKQLHVLTVDHCLRAESAQEASKVAAWCAARDIAHETLVWQGKKPETGLQEAARKVRYGLLAAACNRLNATHLLVAHHGDDQAETVFARLARGAGLSGLAAMAPSRLIAAGAGVPVTLWRPLLALPGARLKATAVAQDLPVSGDPSNLDPRFERVRRRAFLAASSVQGFLDSDALQRTAARLQRDKALAEEALMADFTVAGGHFDESSAICFDASALNALSTNARARLLGRAAYAVSAAEHVPELDLPDPLPVKNGVFLTQAGAILWGKDGKAWLAREPAAVLGRKDGSARRRIVPIAGAEPLLWDNRLIVSLSEVPEGATLEPFACEASPKTHQARLLASLPALWQGEEIIAAPDYAKKIPEMCDSPWNRNGFCLHTTLLTRERFGREVLRF